MESENVPKTLKFLLIFLKVQICSCSLVTFLGNGQLLSLRITSMTKFFFYCCFRFHAIKNKNQSRKK